MKEKILIISLLLISLSSIQCKQTNEPDDKQEMASNITETSAEGPHSFIGTIDLNDWDPSAYDHLTFKQDYWINWATTDTIGISTSTDNSMRIHNLSQTSSLVKTSISIPFKCSIDSFILGAKQTLNINLSIDSNLIGQDTLILGDVFIKVGTDNGIRYILRWAKPKSNTGGVVVVRVDAYDRLFPAYPNPADGHISLTFSVKEDKPVLLYVLNSELQPIDTLVNEFKKAGTYHYTWLYLSEERSKLASGIYRIVYQTDSYSRFGDILYQK